MRDEVEIFLVRVNYNSGIQEEFWCTDFKVEGHQYTWEPAFYGNTKTRPVILSPENIESVWQVDAKKVTKNFVR